MVICPLALVMRTKPEGPADSVVLTIGAARLSDKHLARCRGACYRDVRQVVEVGSSTRSRGRNGNRG